MHSYFTVHARDGKIGAGQLGACPPTIEGAREQFRYWREAGAAAVRVIRHDVYAGSPTEHTVIFDGEC